MISLKNVVFLALFFSLFIACSNKGQKSLSKDNEAINMENQQIEQKGPPVIIYKTTKDYNNNVPVTLNKEKNAIVSYPDPRDLFIKGELSYPVELAQGYLLDQRGIDENVAFLDITYSTYSKSMRVFTVEQLFEMIIDKDPLLEMYHCGYRSDYINLVEELNQSIEKQGTTVFKKIR